MGDILLKHSLIAICVALFLEELAIPMPIPTDLLVVYAGYEAARSLPRLALWLVLLTAASALGATGLYYICRRGGRPLVDRFGRYIHFGPDQLERFERLLHRFGWWGIAFGRALPGLRTVTVVACGIFRVPYWRFISAHTVGTALYVGVFLTLGALFGPAVLEAVHIPAQWIRLAGMLLVALGLPGLCAWLYYRAHAQLEYEPSRRLQVGSLLLAGFAGAVALGAAWAAAATIAEIVGYGQNLDMTRLLARLLEARGLAPLDASVAIYVGMLVLAVILAFGFYELPLRRAVGTSVRRQLLSLTLLCGALVALIFVPPVLFFPRSIPAQLWRSGGSLFPFALGTGVVGYAFATVYARALAITVLPRLSRTQPMRAITAPTETEPDPEPVEQTA